MARGAQKVLFVFGTRPEAIKLAPVILAMRGDRRFRPVVCATAQHREMLDQALGLFRISPRYDLDVMRPDQTLAYATSAILTRLDDVLRRERPDRVVVQGDTTSTFAGGLAAFYRGVPVAHVEAGLRTHRSREPFPEELNRTLTARVAELHFAPTAAARENLLAEGIAPGRVVVTGNTAVDALLLVKSRIESVRARAERLRRLLPPLRPGLRRLLVTGHRRESFGDGIREICAAIREIACGRPPVDVVFPVHRNPNIRGPVGELLGGIGNVHLLDPLEYETFVFLMMSSDLILTDSGGIQEEAPSLGKPVLVMRRATERKEAVAAGAARLVGTDRRSIVRQVRTLLSDPAVYRRMAGRRNPFGDGKAAARIVRALADRAGSG